MLQLTIGSFRNPISTQAMSGFSVLTMDSSSFSIGSVSGLILSGISTPAAFTSNTLTLVNSNVIQAYTSISFVLSLSVPLEQNCFLKFIMPTDFTMDDKFTSITGSGFFRPSASSSVVNWITRDTATRTVTIQACQSQFGPDQSGVITFTQIQNPQQVKLTDTFQVFLAKDSGFTISIAQVTSGLTIAAGSLSSGVISSITASVVDSNIIQTETNYTIKFTPSNSLPASNAVILITFPSLITLSTTGCSISSKSSTFTSTAILCAISGQIVTLSSPFNAIFTGGTQLSITISKGTNPQSERDAGVFSVATYIRISSVNYLVDSGSSPSNQVFPVGGAIEKGADIIVTQPITYLDNQVYQFTLLFNHYIPQNGYLNFTLPSDITISSSSLVVSTCKRIDTNKQMTCSVNNSTQIEINIDSKAFTAGIQTSSTFSFSVGGLKNPRTTLTTGIFYFDSWDSDRKRIDSSNSQDFFNTAMTTVSDVTSIIVDNTDKTNSAITTYTFTITPNTPIIQGDQIQMNFPTEVTLPAASSLTCTLSSVLLIQQITCIKLSYSLLQVTLAKSNTLSEGTTFSFSVNNVVNPISTKPSSAFTDFYISTSVGGYGISKYDKNDITVTTSTSSTITSRKLTQSNKNPSEEAIYTITFTTYNGLPRTTAILITAPSIITLNQVNTTCYVALTSIQRGVCTINQTLIRVENAFATQTIDYFGEVSIIFQAINPSDNYNLQSIILRTYTDATYEYRMNKIESGLTPSLECNYPCRRCNLNNPDYCTDCFTGVTFPQFVQYNSSNGQQQCVYNCSKGYTSNGSRVPKRCFQCDSKCETCFQNDTVGDVFKCLTCSKDYPFSYTKSLSCQQKCWDGQYQCKFNECCDCEFPCKTCLSPSLCRSCDFFSTRPFLWIDKCVDKCPSGFTLVGSQCQKCTSPCATCSEGIPSSCLTCDSISNRQLLFGRSCVSQCPEGTTPVMSNITQSKCVGCVTGCLTCDSDNNALCLKCDSNLALFKNQCYTECPFNYIKSKDGSVCELRTYLLNESLVYFPFGSAAVLIMIVSITGFLVTKKRSLIISNALALLGILEWGCLLYQIYYAYDYSTNYLIITLASLGVLASLFLLNLIFLFFYCARIQYSDIGFNYWRQKYSATTGFIILVSLFVNFKVFRLLYSRFFGIERFSANIDDIPSFTRKIQVFSIVSIFTFTLPLVTIDVVVLYYLTWGSQLYITCFESGGIAMLGAFLIAFDNCCMCSRLSYFQESEARKARQRTKEKYNPIMLDQSKHQAEFLVMGGYEDEESKIQVVERANALTAIVNSVKNNQAIRFDSLHSQLSDSWFPPHRRVASMQNIQTRIPDELKGEDDRQTRSDNLSPITLRNKANASLRTMAQDRQRKMKNLLKQDKYAESMKEKLKFNNVYAESVIPIPPVVIPEKPQVVTIDIQTDKSIPLNAKAVQLRDNKKALDDTKAEESIDSFDESMSSQHRRRKKNRQRGKSKNPYYTQINEEDEDDLLSLGDDTQREFLKTAYEHDDEDDDSDSDGQSDPTTRKRKSRNPGGLQNNKQSMLSSGRHSKSKGSNQSFNKQVMSLESQKLAQELLIKQQQMQQLLQNQIEQEYFNSRTFNINDIMGEFVRNDQGGILNRKEQLEENSFKDMKGRPVNQKGYLINQDLKCIINAYNLNQMFKQEDISGNGGLPMPYRFEKYNFNPHDVMGNFDFQQGKPIILKNKQGQLVDKHLRPVNKAGYLIDDLGNIIDSQGKLKLMSQQLLESGDLPEMYNYKGNKFEIKNIIGQFNRDSATKQIIINVDPEDNTTLVDKLGQRVNHTGYLVDRIGNIISKEGKIVFFKSQLLFNEPPKLFPFMKFKLEWVQGNLNFDELGIPLFDQSQVQTSDQNPQDVILYDLDGRRVNSQGYLIDDLGNIVDKQGYVTFKKEVLEHGENRKQTQVPKVFRLGVFENHNILLNQGEIEDLPSQMQDSQINQINIFENNLAQDLANDHENSIYQEKQEEEYEEQQDEQIYQDEGSQIQNLDQDEEVIDPLDLGIISDDPDPLLDRLNDPLPPVEDNTRKSKKKLPIKVPKPQPRQATKLMNAYQSSRPISSYLPQQYQQRAQSQVKQRIQQHRKTMQIADMIDNQGLKPAAQRSSSNARIMSSKSGLNQTANMHGYSSSNNNNDIFKKNAKSALGFTEDFSSGNHMPVMKNQYMISNQIDMSEQNKSYSAYLEGDVDSTAQVDFNWKRERQGKGKKRRIKQNESQLENLYEQEVSKYIDQSEDDNDDTIFYENFNLGQGYQNERRNASRSKNRGKNFNVYDHQGVRLDSRDSNDSQMSKRGIKMTRSKKHLLQIGSKLRNLENIYLQSNKSSASMRRDISGVASVKRLGNQTQNMNGFGGVKQLKNLKDKYYDRDPSPIDERAMQTQSYLGRRRISQ